MKARHTIMVIGKCLMVLAFLWPIPLQFVIPYVCQWFGYWEVPMWGDDNLYWWPMGICFVVGLLITLLASNKSKDAPISSNQDVPARLFMVATKWSAYIVVGFFVLTLVVLGLYYTICTEYNRIIVPILIGVGVIGQVVWYASKYYEYVKSKEKRKKK